MTPFPRPQFLSLVASILGCPPSYVTWKGSPEPAYMKPAAPFAWASLRIGTSSRVTVGADDLRQIDNGDGTFNVNTVGRRQIILSIDCFTWDSTLAHIADELLEQLMTQIYRPANLDIVNGMAIVLESNGPIIPLPTTINARYISAAHVDLTVALANQDVSSAAYPGGDQYIGEVRTSGDVGTGTPQTITTINR